MSFYSSSFIFRNRSRDSSEVTFMTIGGEVYKLKPADLIGFESAKADGTTLDVPLDAYEKIKENIAEEARDYKKALKVLYLTAGSVATLVSAGLYFLNPAVGVAALSYMAVKFGAALPRARDFVEKEISRKYREYVRDYLGTLHRLAVQSMHIELILDAKEKYEDAGNVSLEDMRKLALIDEFTRTASSLPSSWHIDGQIEAFKCEHGIDPNNIAYAYETSEPKTSYESQEDLRPLWRKVVEMPYRLLRDVPQAVRGYASLFNMQSFNITVPEQPSTITVHMPQIHVG